MWPIIALLLLWIQYIECVLDRYTVCLLLCDPICSSTQSCLVDSRHTPWHAGCPGLLYPRLLLHHIIIVRLLGRGSGSALIFPLGSGSRRKKSKDTNRKNARKLVAVIITVGENHSSYATSKVVDPDPHLFSLLDPDPGEKNIKYQQKKCKKIGGGNNYSIILYI